MDQLKQQIEELEAAEVSPEEREEQQKQEDDDEADKKADYMKKEREFLENLVDLQHGSAIYPIGRDRLYRRYWMFKCVPGIFVEDDEKYVSEAALVPVSQNPEGSAFDLSDPYMIPPRLRREKAVVPEPEKQSENKDGSDKENESVNANENAGTNTNNSSQNSTVSGITVITTDTEVSTDNVVSNKSDAIVISDDETSNDKSDTFVDTEATKQIKNRIRCHWSFFTKQEDIDNLIDALNGRGYRESALKSLLLEQKNRIDETVIEVQRDLLHIPDTEEIDEKGDVMSPKVKVREWRRGRRNVTGAVKNDSAHEGLELNLRELILDLEERIHVGSLGYIKVFDRAKWRDAIENGSYEPNCDDPFFNSDEGENPEIQCTPKDESAVVAISKDMAKALIQIERGIDVKYMQLPIGDEKSKLARMKTETQKKGKKKLEEDDSDEEDTPSKPPPKTLLEKWEDACLLSTSLAQVFLHLSSLEKSVTWSKSLLHTRCRICRRKGDPEKLLLCDGCDRGHHIYCLKPALKHIPKEDWFCPDCRPKETKRSPRKDRRKTFSEESDEEEMEIEEEVEEEEVEAEDEESCPEQLPEPKRAKIKMNLGKGKGKKKNTSPKSNASSSRQSSKKSSPRDSPVTVKQDKKRKRAESPLVEEVPPKLKKGGRSASKLSIDNKMDEVKHYTSSSRGNSKVLQLKLLEDLVMNLVEEDEAWPFLRPVMKKDAPDYYDLIKNPMDFQTIKNKIKKFQYGDPAEIVQDVRQIFSNCIEYNKRTTAEFKAGANMSKLFERKLKNLSEQATTNGPSTKRARTK